MMQPGGYAKGGLVGYAKGGLVGYAKGGSVAQQGAAYLKAWQTRHGGPYGLAVGPVVLNQQIAAMSAAVSRARTLSKAGGLSAGQHRFWANAAASESRLLATYGKELVTERAWRNQLGMNELGLDKQIRAAGNLPGLAGPVKGWKAQLALDKATVAAISKMLGYSNAYIAAHPAAKPAKPPKPVVTPPSPNAIVSSVDTAGMIAQIFASIASNSRVVTLDSGGWLMPGVQAVANRSGRPEQVLPGRGGGGAIVLQNHGVIGSQAQLEDWLVRSYDNLKRKRRL